jgi:short-chain fatty acids transporter
MATPESLPAGVRSISGVIPLPQTIGLWQSQLIALVLIGVSALIAYASAPLGADAKSMTDMGVTYSTDPPAPPRPSRPGEWLEYSPLLTIVISALAATFLITEIARRGALALLNLNTYIFAFAMAGLLLHWRPRSFVRAVNEAVPSVGGVLVQYPLYAGMIRMMTESGLAQRMAHLFVDVSTTATYPLTVGVYSAVLGLFVPSAGGKWLIEAPYLLSAAQALRVNLGWVVQTYNATEALANLIHPFWMLPLLGILGLKPRDIIGYSVLQFIVHVPVVLFLVWLLNFTLTYAPPLLP